MLKEVKERSVGRYDGTEHGGQVGVLCERIERRSKVLRRGVNPLLSRLNFMHANTTYGDDLDKWLSVFSGIALDKNATERVEEGQS